MEDAKIDDLLKNQFDNFVKIYQFIDERELRDQVAEALGFELTEREHLLLDLVVDKIKLHEKNFKNGFFWLNVGYPSQGTTVADIINAKKIKDDYNTFIEYLASNPELDKQWKNLRMQMRLYDGVTLVNEK